MLNRYLTHLGQRRLSLFLHIVGLAAIALVVFKDAFEESPLERIQAQIRFQLPSGQTALFFRERNHKPVWHDPSGALTVNAQVVLQNLLSADAEGLLPEEYIDMNFTDRIADGEPSPPDIAKREIAITEGLLKYIEHMKNGRVPVEIFGAEWQKKDPFNDGVAFLQASLEENRLLENLFKLAPHYEQYSRLKQKLRYYRETMEQGGWPTLSDPKMLSPGKRNHQVKLLRERLVYSGDLNKKGGNSDAFDDELKEALTRFQFRNGLLADGMMGAETLAALNVPVEERIQQIVVNLERWRHMPNIARTRFLFVNAAGYELQAFNNGQKSFEMRVIIGEKELQTPVLFANLKQIVINPQWHVSRDIAIKEILPKVLQNPGYLNEKGFYLTYADNSNGDIVNAEEVDWTALHENYFPYALHQKSSQFNPLGKFKFVIPNESNIFLHDTPAKHHFNSNRRDLSHGCVRVEYPEKLARFLLNGDSYWTASAIKAQVDKGDEYAVDILDPVPVYITYMTAWVNDDGRTAFYKDIYELDGNIGRALPKLSRSTPH